MTNLYRNESSDPKRNAQRNLCGRTHYVDDDTLRGFHSRVLSARDFHNGLVFAIVTSDAADHENKSRLFRYVIFNLFGDVIERNPASLDAGKPFKNSQQAMAGRDKALLAIDAKAITLAAIERKTRQHANEMADLAKTINALPALEVQS